LIESAHAHGLQVHVWTVNNRSEMAELLDLGVDGIITDRPDVLKELLEDRGEWR
jgi:glycerophosphoryl diester phosphodiesterase